jgi:hypothetical protein
MQAGEAFGKRKELGERNIFGGSAPKQSHFVIETLPRAKLLSYSAFLCSFPSQEGFQNNPSKAS